MPIDAQSFRETTQNNQTVSIDKYLRSGNLSRNDTRHVSGNFPRFMHDIADINNTLITCGQHDSGSMQGGKGAFVAALLLLSMTAPLRQRNNMMLDVIPPALSTRKSTLALVGPDQYGDNRVNTAPFDLNMTTRHDRHHNASDLGQRNTPPAYRDPLRFPAAEASHLSHPPRLRDLAQAIHRGPIRLPDVIEFKEKKLARYVIAALGGDDDPLRYGIEEISPMVMLLPKADQHYRVIRNADMSQQNDNIIDYEKNTNTPCRIKTKNLDGRVVGNGLLVGADQLSERAPHLSQDFARLVSGGHQRTLARMMFSAAINQGADVLLGYCTSELNPLIKYGLALGFRDMGRNIDGDGTCAKYKLTLDGAASSVLTGFFSPINGYSTHGVSESVKSRELTEAIPFQPQGLFVQQAIPSGINTEKKLSVEHQGKTYFLHEGEGNQFFATQVSEGESTDRYIDAYFDDDAMKVHFSSDMPVEQGMDANIVNGKSFITLNGENHELVYDWQNKRYQIVVNNARDEVKHIPVYMEPLSATWLMETENYHDVFNQLQSELVSALSVPIYNDYHYSKKYAIDSLRNGKGHLYEVTHQSDSSRDPGYDVVELKGRLLPVRLNASQEYEVYDSAQPDEPGSAIEHDGNRWIFKRSSSIHASSMLQETFPDELYTDSVDARTLSGPDHRGLRWDQDNQAYLKVNNRYIKMTSQGDDQFLVEGEVLSASLRFHHDKFDIVGYSDMSYSDMS